MVERNPYAPPAAAVEDERTALGEDVLVPNGRRRPARHGWKWIAQGWDLFKRQPGMWVLSVVLVYAVMLPLSLIPFSKIAMSVVWPIVGAGFFAMAQLAFSGERFGVGDLFAGFKKNPGPLALIGVTYVAVVLSLVAIFAALGGSVWYSVFSGRADPMAVAGLGAALLIYLLVVMMVGVCISFAPALVFFNNVSSMAAMKMSVLGCLKNVLPGAVYALLFSVIFIVSVIPLGLGLLITLPLLVTTFYCAYRDIFVQPAQS